MPLIRLLLILPVLQLMPLQLMPLQLMPLQLILVLLSCWQNKKKWLLLMFIEVVDPPQKQTLLEHYYYWCRYGRQCGKWIIGPRLKSTLGHRCGILPKEYTHCYSSLAIVFKVVKKIGLGTGVVVRGGVHDFIVPLAMGRNFGHDGGGSIDFLLVF